ncbi:MAG TPA: DUF929 family protein [Solirubrobacteraceae bacterium]|nr:DUF929 family protein [Solirubrobacteraceae bacterium]
MRAVAVVLACTLAAAPAALAAPTPPLQGLAQARRGLAALALAARSPGAAKLARSAEGELARATAPALWIDPSHVLAPGHGLVVFARSRGALLDLEHAPSGSLPSGGLSEVEHQILTADRGLAEGSILQALGGPGGLLSRARGMILSGDRWSVTSRVDLGAEQYGAGWGDAFQALDELVRVRVAFVSPGALASGASRALRNGAQTRPAGVRVLAGHGALTRSGKPELLYVGLESCPACSIERWGLVVALSQFGVFSQLHLGQSAVAENPFVRSFTFAGARYVSPYLSFDAVEVSSDLPAPGGGFQTLDRLTPAQGRLLRSLDARQTAPFVDVANQFADVGATVSPNSAQGLSWSQLAASVRRPRTPAGQAIAASAEVFTAEICRATGGEPASVCSSAVVRDYTSRLARFGARAAGCPVGGGGARRAARISSILTLEPLHTVNSDSLGLDRAS